MLTYRPQSCPCISISHHSSMEDGNKEFQLLSSIPYIASSSSHDLSWPLDSSTKFRSMDHFEDPSLELQLSVSVSPLKPVADRVRRRKVKDYDDVIKLESSRVEALKWQAAEQARLAAMENAYAERVKDLTRREMEIAQSEFVCARYTWERAREEVEKMKAIACRHIDSTCREITCQSCRQKFRP